jgi:DNA-binding NarL/FixJ family response regulator
MRLHCATGKSSGSILITVSMQEDIMKASELELIRVLGLSRDADLLLTVREQIRRFCPICLFDMADTFENGAQYLASFSYDLVILDLETDRRYELLKRASSHNLPVIALIGCQCDPKTAIHLIMSGVRSFLLKSEIKEIVPAIEQILHIKSMTTWKRTFKKLEEILF